MSTIGSCSRAAFGAKVSQWVKTGLLVNMSWVCFFVAGASHVNAAALKHSDTAKSASIAIHSAVTVTGNRIYLSDVMESDTLLPTHAKSTVLMTAPAPGKDKFLPGKWVASVVRTKGRISDSIVISAPEQVHIRRAHQTLMPERLEHI